MVFKIISSMSTLLPIKNWINSINKDIETSKIKIFENFLNLLYIIGNKNPKGRKIITFPEILIIECHREEYFI